MKFNKHKNLRTVIKNEHPFLYVVIHFYIRETEDGRSFLLRSTKLWDNLPVEIRRKDSLPAFKKSLRNLIFKEQLSLNHFHI